MKLLGLTLYRFTKLNQARCCVIAIIYLLGQALPNNGYVSRQRIDTS